MQFLPDVQDHHPTDATEAQRRDASMTSSTFDAIDDGGIQILTAANHWPSACPPYPGQFLPGTQERCPAETPLPITQSLEFAVAAIDGDHLQLTAAATNALRAAAAQALREFRARTLIWARPWSQWPWSRHVASWTCTDDGPGSRRSSPL